MAIHTPAVHPAATHRVIGVGWILATIIGIVVLTVALLFAFPAAGPGSSEADRGLDHSGLRGDYTTIMSQERGYEGSGMRR